MTDSRDIYVYDKKTFVEFLNAFRDDFRKNGHLWENNTLESFLKALAAYSEDLQGYYDNLELALDVDKPSFRIFADMLKGATVYE